MAAEPSRPALVEDHFGPARRSIALAVSGWADRPVAMPSPTEGFRALVGP